MRKFEINETLNSNPSKIWEYLTNLDNYPKYFKHTEKVFYKGEMKLGSEWYEFATFVFPLIVKHKTTVFDKEKALGFDVYIPLKGYVRERLILEKKGESTVIKASIEFDFGNPVFVFLFENIFEKRLKEAINGALTKFKKEI